jgi:hypothetical protein
MEKKLYKKKLLKGAGVLLIAAAMILSATAATANTASEPRELTTSGTPLNLGTGEARPLSQPIVWDNGGTMPGGNSVSSQNDTCYPFVSQVADDFHFEEPTTVADVHWWGGFWGSGNPIDPLPFWIFFYNDDGTGTAPTGGGLPDPGPTAIAAYFFPGVTGLPLDPNGYYEYHVYLDPPMVFEPCHKYWIAIQSVFCFPPQWGWADTAGMQLSSAVQGFPLLGMPFWTVLGYDMAFYLTGEGPPPIPDLDCYPDIVWEDVPPNSVVTETVTIANIGDPMSYLDWSVQSFPTDWGTGWSATPPSGTDLPEGSTETVVIEVTAPPDKKKTFTGQIVFVNDEDPDDICIIQVSLTTPKSNAYFQTFLQWLFERFPLLEYLFA